MLTGDYEMMLAAMPTSSSVAFSYWSVLFLLILSVSFAVCVLMATHMLGPKRDGAIKGGVYESGMNPVSNARKRFNVRYYLLAVTFLVFDVEIIFLYPWATTFRQIDAQSAMGGLFLGRILFFLFTSFVAYVYAWRKGVFRFD